MHDRETSTPNEMLEEPMIHAIEKDYTDALLHAQENEREIRHAEVDHAFNYWWYNTGSAIPARYADVWEHTERTARAAFQEAVEKFGGPVPHAPAATKPMTEERLNLLYSIFAIGVVVGMGIALIALFFIIKPH